MQPPAQTSWSTSIPCWCWPAPQSTQARSTGATACLLDLALFGILAAKLAANVVSFCWNYLARCYLVFRRNPVG
jgi:hypothetical protein